MGLCKWHTCNVPDEYCFVIYKLIGSSPELPNWGGKRSLSTINRLVTIPLSPIKSMLSGKCWARIPQNLGPKASWKTFFQKFLYLVIIPVLLSKFLEKSFSSIGVFYVYNFVSVNSNNNNLH